MRHPAGLKRVTAALVAATLSVLLVAQPAFAVVPASMQSPAPIQSESFEGAYPGNLTVEPANLIPPATNWWGRTSSIKHSGSWSLWAAGTNGTWPYYAQYTYGLATFNMPQLADYYSSQLSFFYNQPSLGAADYDSFNVMWYLASGGTRDTHYGIPLTGATQWLPLTYDMASPSNRVNISRQAAKVRFQFVDTEEGYGESPATGQGPSIDDVSITGYKYGPIRSLTATRSGTTTVILNWAKPPVSTASSADDTRAIGYRVWRSYDSSPTDWKELTTSRGTPRTFTDSDAPTVAAHYFVQAWDPTTNDWGDPSGSSVAVPADVDNTKPISNISTLPSGWATASVTWSLTATDEAWNTLTKSYRESGATNVATTTYTTPVTTSADGTTTITYWAQDQALNTETPKTATVRIDKTPPVTTAQVSYGTSNTASVTFNPSDLTSGVGHTYYAVDGQPYTYNGTPLLLSAPHTITYWSVDNAGNPEGVHTQYVDPTVPAIPAGETRVYGSTRIDTAADISQKAFPNPGMATAAVVANGYGWTDALPATALAAAVRGPLLLAHSYLINGDVDPQVKSEITRLGIKTIYVVGNDVNIQPAVRVALANIPGVTSVQRVSGGAADVYTASQNTAHQVKVQRGNTTGGVVFISRSDVFADALAASSLAAKMKAPIILVPHSGTTIPAASIVALQDINPSTVVITGSTMAIPSSIENAVRAAVPGAAIVRKDGRATGTTRYDTALDLINYGTTTLGLNANPDGIYIARGDDAGGGADALAGGVLAGSSYDGIWRPMMITAPTSFSPQAANYMDAHTTIKWARIMGSDKAISSSVYSQVATHLH